MSLLEKIKRELRENQQQQNRRGDLCQMKI